MAKLSNTKNNKPIPIGTEGIYIHNMPAKQMQDIFGVSNERLAEDPEAVVVELFTKLVCDSDGEQFEDVGTYEAILEVLSLKDIQEITRGIAEAMNPNALDVGK